MRERLEGHGADELGGGLGHDHAHVHAGLLQAAQQFGGLVGGDSPRYPKEDDGLIGHHALLAGGCYAATGASL